MQAVEPDGAAIAGGGGILGAGAVSLLAHIAMKPAQAPLASGAWLA